VWRLSFILLHSAHTLAAAADNGRPHSALIALRALFSMTVTVCLSVLQELTTGEERFGAYSRQGFNNNNNNK